MTTERANRAKRLLNHYLRMAVEGSGQRCWDSDNTAEVDDIVDSIVEASHGDTGPAGRARCSDPHRRRAGTQRRRLGAHR